MRLSRSSGRGLRWGLGFALLGAVALFFLLGLHRWASLQTLQSIHGDLQAWAGRQPLRAALSFAAIYIATTALSLPGAALLTLVGGALFGLAWGTLIVSFASTIGATLAFLAARWLFRDALRRRLGERLAAIDAGFAREGAEYLFSLRLVPVIPFFLVNLAMGLTPIRPWTFYWISQLAMLPATVIYVNAGTQLAQLDSVDGIASPAVLVSLVVLGLFPLATRRLLDWRRARRVYAGWRRPARFDRNLVVIGAGSAGLVSAYIASALKARVTLVEKERMGGDCLNTGCVPSKTLLDAARRHAQQHGQRRAQRDGADDPIALAMARVREVIARIEPHDSVERYTGLGVEVLRGAARLVSPWEIEVICADGTTQRRSARSIVIAAGARPTVPKIPGIEQIEVLTSENVWSLDALPPRLAVLGGGPIGCELAQAFARLGSSVTIVERSPQLLLREDADASALVATRLQAEGITLKLGFEASRIELENGERVLVVTASGGQDDAQGECRDAVRLGFDALLVAVGRHANMTGYGLEALGIEVGETITVDPFMRTNFPNVFAAGDVAGPMQFTHAASHQAWHASVNALLAPLHRIRLDDRVIPSATFTDPEVARVGLNEQEAARRGIAFEITRFDFGELDRAIIDDACEGFVKVLTAPRSDRILGVTIVGARASELIAEWVLAIRHRIGLNGVLATVHIYPTFAEANKAVAGAWKRNHAPRRLLAWAERIHRRRLG